MNRSWYPIAQYPITSIHSHNTIHPHVMMWGEDKRESGSLSVWKDWLPPSCSLQPPLHLSSTLSDFSMLSRDDSDGLNEPQALNCSSGLHIEIGFLFPMQNWNYCALQLMCFKLAITSSPSLFLIHEKTDNSVLTSLILTYQLFHLHEFLYVWLSLRCCF